MCVSRSCSTLGRSDKINVFCYPVKGGISVYCVLDFRIDDNLHEGCILGVDYFAGISPELCELLEFFRLHTFVLTM